MGTHFAAKTNKFNKLINDYYKDTQNYNISTNRLVRTKEAKDFKKRKILVWWNCTPSF